MKTISRATAVTQVTEAIRESILSGEIKEGQKLPTERELCARLAVGRSTLREAVRVLEATGYVVMQPGKGAFAAQKKDVQLSELVEWFSEHEVELMDFIEVRMAIEPLAVQCTIQRASAEEVEHICRIHKEFLEAAGAGDAAQVTLSDERFHNAIVGASKNKLLISIYQKIDASMQAFRNQTFKVPQNVQNAIRPHTAIVEAILRKDVEGGRQHMAQHLELVKRDLEALTKTERE